MVVKLAVLWQTFLSMSCQHTKYSTQYLKATHPEVSLTQVEEGVSMWARGYLQKHEDLVYSPKLPCVGLA